MGTGFVCSESFVSLSASTPDKIQIIPNYTSRRQDRAWSSLLDPAVVKFGSVDRISPPEHRYTDGTGCCSEYRVIFCDYHDNEC